MKTLQCIPRNYGFCEKHNTSLFCSSRNGIIEGVSVMSPHIYSVILFELHVGLQFSCIGVRKSGLFSYGWSHNLHDLVQSSSKNLNFPGKFQYSQDYHFYEALEQAQCCLPWLPWQRSRSVSLKWRMSWPIMHWKPAGDKLGCNQELGERKKIRRRKLMRHKNPGSFKKELTLMSFLCNVVQVDQ